MRVRVKPASEVRIPPELELYCNQRFLSDGKDYEVHAISVWLSGHFPHPPMVLFLVVDDFGYTFFFPHILFEIVDRTIPDDWQCNTLDGDGGPTLVLGPDFLVKNVESYNAMAEHDLEQLDRFWQRLDAIEKAREEQRWLEELDKKEGEDTG